MAEHKYKLTYKIERHPEGMTKEQLDKIEGIGACDAILFASIIYPEDGSLSVYFVGEDGRTDAELEDNEWFKVWSMLSHRLAKSTTLSPNKRELCQVAFECVAAPMRAARAAEMREPAEPEKTKPDA